MRSRFDPLDQRDRRRARSGVHLATGSLLLVVRCRPFVNVVQPLRSNESNRDSLFMIIPCRGEPVRHCA